MKIFTNVLALSILLALLAACGDESSSSVSPEPGDDSSSSVIPASSDDDLSSSSQKSSGEEKSSSSEKNAKESSSSVSTVKNSSSSSVKKEDSNSSVVIASSSSVTPKSSSSEDVKQSSSSAVASSSSVAEQSSSSEYVPYNHRRALYSDSVLTGAYKQFTDSRNGRSYYYLTIDGVDKDGNPASVTVFAENLNIGVMVDGDKDQTNDLEIERYCYDNDTTNCDKYGGLYQWAEMMNLSSECNTKSCANLIKPNHQGICPDGWRLLTEDDFYIVMHANGNKHGAEDVRATSFGGYNNSGYSLLGAGMHLASLGGGGFKQLDDVTYWFYASENAYDNNITADDGYLGKTARSYQSNVSYKQSGLSVRCVMVN